MWCWSTCKARKTLIAGADDCAHGHFMPPGLLDSQFQTLEEPAADEHPIVASIAPAPEAIVAAIIGELKQREHLR